MTNGDSPKFQGLRQKLVQQLKLKGITDIGVLNAILKIPRHLFLDSAIQHLAYEDQALPIEAEQTISQPFTVAYQTQLLGVKKRDKILEIGTGSGYQTCVLLELGAKVFSIERQRTLFDSTKKFLPTLGYNPTLFLGDGTLGKPTYGPYDKIIVTAGAPEIPQKLLEQLKTGGKLVIPVGDEKSQKMILVTKKGDDLFSKEEFENFRFVPLIGKEGWNK